MRFATAVGAAMLLACSAAFAQQPGREDPAALRDEAFVAAQYAQITAAAAAVDRVSARLAGGGGALAALEERRDSKIAEIDSLEKQFIRQLENGQQASPVLGERRQAARTELAALDAEIERQFPQYFELTRPRPLAVADTQALLNTDEALLLALVLDDATYVWAVTREGARWHRADQLGAKALQAKVDALRTSMKVPNSRGSLFDDEPGPGTPGPAQESAFDRKLAFELYQALVAPLEPLLKGKQLLLTNVSGPLTSLPLSLLVTAAPQGRDDDAVALAATPWLGDRFALAELPSVSSLRALRCLLIARREEAHRGCKSIAVSPAYNRSRSGGVVLVGVGAPVLEGRTAAKTPAAALPGQAQAAVYRGGLADPRELRALDPLPFAAAELKTLGSVFGPRAVIKAGPGATEAAVKTTAELRNARFLVFSTHGLLASEVSSAVEPGLVFTPPQSASAEDDGLLTASEAAQLRITADLAVLSACNTAASNGKAGAEGLSGLARAFLFAGARSLLVSHWAVSDSATSLLMEQTFRNIEQGGDLASRARALQAAMKAVRNEGAGNFASPKYWAAFTLVGDPGR